MNLKGTHIVTTHCLYSALASLGFEVVFVLFRSAQWCFYVQYIGKITVVDYFSFRCLTYCNCCTVYTVWHSNSKRNKR